MAAVVKQVIAKLFDLQEPAKTSRLEFFVQAAATGPNILAAVKKAIALSGMGCDEYNVIERVQLAGDATVAHAKATPPVTPYTHPTADDRMVMLADSASPEAQIRIGVPGPIDTIETADGFLNLANQAVLDFATALGTALACTNQASLFSNFTGGGVVKKRY